RIEPDDGPGLAQDARGALRDHAGPRGDVEELHADAQPRLQEHPAPVVAPGAERAEVADEVVVLGGVVEEGADERPAVALALVIFLQNGMRHRAAVCRVVPIARVAAHIVVGAPPRRTVRDERRRDKGLVDGTSILSTPPLRAGPPRYRNRPRLGSTTDHRSPSATVEFMRVGLRLIGHAQEDLPYTGSANSRSW